MYLCTLSIYLRLSSSIYQAPGNGIANGEAKRGHEPSHSFKDLAARGSGSSFDAGPLGVNYQGNGAHSRQHTTERAVDNSSSDNSHSKDKGNKQLEDIRRMLNRKEEVSKSAGRTNSLIDKFEKQSSAAGGARRYGGGGGNSSDEDDRASHPNSGYNSSARVSRVSSFDYDDDDDDREDHEGQEVLIGI